MIIEIRFALFANFEIWIFYTRFFLNIEFFWNNNIIWFESLLKMYVCIHMLYQIINCFHEIWKIVVIAIFASNILFIIWKIIVIVIFAFVIVLFDSYQFVLKIWKSFSWMIQKKHDLMISLFVVFKIENLISYNLQFSIWWLTINWITTRFEFESIYIFVFFIFLLFTSNRWIVWKKWLNAKDVE